MVYRIEIIIVQHMIKLNYLKKLIKLKDSKHWLHNNFILRK